MHIYDNVVAHNTNPFTVIDLAPNIPYLRVGGETPNYFKK